MYPNNSISLAPMQGFTDHVFRNCFHHFFGTIDEYYIPYISLGKSREIRNSQLRDILPENNDQVPIIPQILCSNKDELKNLCVILKDFGYNKINLNLGCPYPMATKRGRGTGLLEDEYNLKEVLDSLFSDYDFAVSAKFRSGLTNNQIIFQRIHLFNSYPFEKLIFHPRTANQMYKGSADRYLFAELKNLVKAPLVYNGDIVSNEDIIEIKRIVPDQNEWMIGKGILSNPFLPEEIKNKLVNHDSKSDKLLEYHNCILEEYMKTYPDQGTVLKKMEQFWFYFSYSFEQGKKVYKAVKKSRTIDAYNNSVFPFIR